MKYLTSILLLTLLVGIALPVLAADLESAKRDGLVGERADGYLGVVNSDASKDIAELVRSINGKRQAEYERIATENSLTIEQVQALAGKKAIERTVKGGWILENGGWQRK